MEVALLFLLALHVLGCGISIGLAVDEFIKRHYTRFGWAIALAISNILFMAEVIFKF